MKKQTIRINESTLRNIIKESVKKILKEDFSIGDANINDDIIQPDEVIEPLKRNVSPNYEYYDSIYQSICELQKRLGLSREQIMQFVNGLCKRRDRDYMYNQCFIVRLAIKNNDMEELKRVYKYVCSGGCPLPNISIC